MKNWLKRQFVPHEVNGFRPLILRRESAWKLAGALTLLELVLFILPTLYYPQYARDLRLGSVLPAVLSTLTNEERVKNNLPALAGSPLLTRAAELKAQDMARRGYFAHNSPDGLTPWHWFNLVGYSYVYAGENLAVNFSESEEVTRAWMQSPAHLANLVGKNYTEMGTGIASGVYKGQETFFVVQLYGTPKLSAGSVTQPPVQNVAQVSRLAPKPSPGPAASAPNTQPTQTRTSVNSEALNAAPGGANGETPDRQILGESAPETPDGTPNFLQRFMTSPENTTNAVLYLVFAVVMLASFLNIVIKFEYQFPDLIANGAVVALFIVGIHLGNNYFVSQRIETSFVEAPGPAEAVSPR